MIDKDSVSKMNFNEMTNDAELTSLNNIGIWGIIGNQNTNTLT